MTDIGQYIENFQSFFLDYNNLQPWEFITDLENILFQRIELLRNDYKIENNIAIHKTATIEQNVILKGTIIISEHCFVAANTYMRGPVFLSKAVNIGPGCEIKQSAIFDNTAIAHFNYIGNCLVGQSVNFEAGSVCANHYNERQNKNISVMHNGKLIDTKTEKFGSLVGDHSRIGANAVLSPGTILEKNSIVKRLELIEQVK